MKSKLPKPYYKYKTVESVARAVAYHKYGIRPRVTRIVPGRSYELLEYIQSGYRKRSTGEYVSNAYRKKGWSNTFYQSSICIVQLPSRVIKWFQAKELIEGE